MHLFDIDIPGGIRFQESEVLTPGDDFFTFDTGTRCDGQERRKGHGEVGIPTVLYSEVVLF